jgi:hypothetical protein
MESTLLDSTPLKEARVHYYAHKRLPPIPIPSQMNPVHSFDPISLTLTRNPRPDHQLVFSLLGFPLKLYATFPFYSNLFEFNISVTFS